MEQQKTYQVIVSVRAKQMLGEHLRFLRQVNPEAAKQTKARIMGQLRTLTHMPQRYPFFAGEMIPSNQYRKLFIDNWYLVLYQIQEETVYVDYILDCRQDYQWLV
jgi:plasmid stabilization system protein ParE